MALPEQPRSILQVTGADRISFLQNLVTNDVSAPGLHYTALLTPQGKYLADFFILNRPDDLLIDIASEICPGIRARLTMYRLRADVQIGEVAIDLCCGMGTIPPDGFADPRHPNLGRFHRLASLARGAYHTRDRDRINTRSIYPRNGFRASERGRF